mgnify:CR=1 FL=1
MMKVLVSTINVGESKMYVEPAFEQMANVVFDGFDLICAVDEHGRTGMPEILTAPEANSFWCTDVCYYAKMDTIRDYFLAGDWTHLVWQGVDCLFDTRDDFLRLVELAKSCDIAGALIAGRNRPDYPVCRRFIDGTREQEEMREDLLLNRQPIVVPGFIGSDATILSRKAVENITMKGYEHWATYKDQCDLKSGALCSDEWFMYRAIKDFGIIPVCHTGIRPWHVHENGLAARYPGEARQLAELSW